MKALTFASAYELLNLRLASETIVLARHEAAQRGALAAISQGRIDEIHTLRAVFEKAEETAGVIGTYTAQS